MVLSCQKYVRPSIRIVFLQQLRQIQKHNILNNSQLFINFYPAEFVLRNLLTVNLEVLELFELNKKIIYRRLLEIFAFFQNELVFK